VCVCVCVCVCVWRGGAFGACQTGTNSRVLGLIPLTWGMSVREGSGKQAGDPGSDRQSAKCGADPVRISCFLPAAWCW
jgi:hypothetical protein